MKVKNFCLSTRSADNPYETWVGDGWTWIVLKKYQVDDNKPFARWFCGVKSPFTFGQFEFGDCFVWYIKQYAVKKE